MHQIYQLCQRAYNMGDILAPVITERLFGIPVHRVYGTDAQQYAQYKLLAGLGSMLANFHDLELHVWGAGYEPGYLLKQYAQAPSARKRWHIHSVRGPHTRALLGAPDDVVLGDPALLVPSFYTPKPTSHEVRRYFLHCGNQTTDDIDVDFPQQRTAEEPFRVIDAIVHSDFVFSEALHVAIIAQAYGIPWAWSFNRHALGVFKWFDLFASIDIAPRCFHHSESVDAQIWAEKPFKQAHPPPTDALLQAFPRSLIVT